MFDITETATYPTDRTLTVMAARAAHEANRGYCRSIGDFSQKDWEKAPEWQRSSVIMGVEAIRANPALTAQESHALWLKVKVDDGWTFGAVKDPSEKTHPCIRPYEELPYEQKVKDHIFGAVVRAVLGLPQLVKSGA